MATLHKIVLVLVRSLDNGTSIPTPQSNRALKNKTTTLALHHRRTPRADIGQNSPNSQPNWKRNRKVLDHLHPRRCNRADDNPHRASRSGIPNRFRRQCDNRTCSPSTCLTSCSSSNDSRSGGVTQKGAIKGGKWLVAVLAE